ncbi:Cell differentiation protein rcd1 [Fulvia fulva]|uniref:DNA-(apurinic or apyrimidinic site) lyase n=1 Tax=Passalora fulva TaxID=5499 RepID=A0A9Q8P4G4_PASFU|nr:Cell differentiation protein rcd1 [Fulvia fulva]KAK4634473.1 Cell differentiation protein rcd1 [Fulvia fulva]KAK4637058.1 Cell differentiation protein rcd1 [Fulvia fulva]UJO12839.1 Cell differentiation protein rcd1 [Fulvia fulva]WPV08460.1 Cell differentiation protein rcd1 [Fulvia fulva]WPV24926.1 Cell differentiation protein rcd1 [Fulvia fulva]
MPEIGEIARTVHYLRKHLVSRTITQCVPFDDDIVYGKKGGTTAQAFSKALTGKKVVSAGQQGKYFYLTFDKPPQAVLHLGMSGWIKYSTEETGYYKQAKKKDEQEEWPPNPKWTKFLLKCEAEGDREAVEVAFVDARRLGRIGLVECPAEEIRQNSPLKENGPDPVVDKDVVTVEWLAELLGKKKVPVKALILDQANISGVGNWVADEVLYQARIHPEQYSNTFGEGQIKKLHDALIDVCTTACETLADSSKFPDTWLMKYRWDKGKKDANVLPNGNKITHITVGGHNVSAPPKRRGRAKKVKEEPVEEEEEVDGAEERDEDEKRAKAKKAKAAPKKAAKATPKKEVKATIPGERKSARTNATNGAGNGINNNGGPLGGSGGPGDHNGGSIIGPGDNITEDNRRVLEWIAQVLNANTREAALLELSKKREQVPELALILWHSFGVMTSLLQEIISVYPLLNPSQLTAAASNRVCNALALLQCVASHSETRGLFLNAHIPLFLYPFLNTTSKSRPFEYLRLTSLGVIGALVKNDSSEVINFLLTTEIIPLCLRIMETGSELSKTVAIFIVQKILLDDMGLQYICQTYERFYAVGTVLSNMVTQLVDQQTVRLLKHVVRCFLRLSDNARAREALRQCLPEPLRDATFSPVLRDDAATKRCLAQLLLALSDQADPGGVPMSMPNGYGAQGQQLRKGVPQ